MTVVAASDINFKDNEERSEDTTQCGHKHATRAARVAGVRLPKATQIHIAQLKNRGDEPAAGSFLVNPRTAPSAKRRHRPKTQTLHHTSPPPRTKRRESNETTDVCTSRSVPTFSLYISFRLGSERLHTDM